ncbi:MAG: phenylalanine--tRNA ligase subunit beta [Candidatus Saccharimonadales bacterium]
MKISLNTIKKYTDIELSIDELATKLNAQLGGIEKITYLGRRYEGVVIVKVVECVDHPDSDHMHICRIDDGGIVTHAERDDDGLVQVVCGAPNVRAGMFAVWLPPRTTVPSSYDEKELFVLSARELRGVVSNGMLASPRELALGDSHEGILEIAEDDEGITPGASFAGTYGLDDTLIDIENKMFTHRPDLFGQIGVAREITGIQHKPFIDPDWYLKLPVFKGGEGLELHAANEAPEQVARFMTVALKNVEIKPSPLWLQAELVRLGGKPINNVVDATNYIMLLTAQPTHAYDYDKLRGHKLVVRMAEAGEIVKLLNDKTYELNEKDIVIADGEGPVGLAGIMGGGESEVSVGTKNIVLEVATFDMYTLRKSSMRHGVFTDALTRFNKGQSPLQNDRALVKLIELLQQFASAELASEVTDIHQLDEKYNTQTLSGLLEVRANFIDERLGLDLSSSEIADLLRNVHFSCTEGADGVLSITAPYWRTDIELPEDIVEEVGRLYGYDYLPRELPKRSTKPAPKNTYRELTKTVRETLARAGANEVLTYSFVHKNVIERAGQDVAQAYQIANALSPDLQYYRLSLTPSLLDKIHGNLKAGHSEFALFEIGKSHGKQLELDEDNLPREDRQIGLTVVSKKKKADSAYYQAKTLLEYLASKLDIALRYESLLDTLPSTLVKPFEAKRSAAIVHASTGQVLGIIGEYTGAVKKGFKLPEYAAGFELLTNALLENWSSLSTYVPLSRYPSTDRDITFRVNSDVNYQEIVDLIGYDDQVVNVRVTPVGIYQAEGESTKNVTIHMTLTPREKTLSSDEANQVVDSLTAIVVAGIEAEVI